MARGTALPPTLPPRLISREAAAAYVNVSPNTFDAMVKAGKMPGARKLTGRRHAWDVRSLDAAVDNLPVDGAEDDGSWSDVDAA
jgi:predicted DNA-binding transcriptional regulator AlpA